MSSRSRIAAVATAITVLSALGVGAAYGDVALSPDEDIQTSTLPYITDVTATFTHTSNDLCVGANGSTWTLDVRDSDDNLLKTQSNADAAATGQFLQEGTGQDKTCPAGTTEQITISDVVFPEYDTYSVRGTLSQNQGGGLDDEITVSFTVFDDSITISEPAAPAVANDLLDGSLKGKQHGKCISAVADHMGSSLDDESGTDFSGVAKSDVQAYTAAVETFLGSTAACGGTPTA